MVSARIMRRMVWVAGVWLALILASCAGSSARPEEAVETFLKALMDRDEDRLYGAICPEWEAQAELELAAFSGVRGTLEGLNCQASGTDGQYTLVACQGKMLLNYNNRESRERSLDDKTYLARQVDGEWKMCGYR